MQGAVKKRIESLRPEDGEENEGFSEVNWLPFARMHITALVGEQLKSLAGSSGSELLGAAVSRERLRSIDQWFESAFGAARDAVEFYIEVQKEADRLHNMRNFFRDRETYRSMVKRVRDRAGSLLALSSS